jgi:SET domain-containing protein 6
MNVYTSGLRKHAQEVRTLGSWPAAIVTLIFEHGKGESSKWWPYFQVLPETFNTLVYWSSEELAELQGSAVLQKSDKASIERMVDDEILPFVVKHHTLFGTHADAFGGPAGREALLPLVGRMGTLIMAYAFDIEKPEMAEEADEDGYVSDDEEGDSGKGMVPLADMLNADGDEKNNVSPSELVE